MIVDASFLLDIILNFFTAYEEKDGRLVSDLKEIASNYLQGFFILDLIASLPLEFLINSTMGASGYAGVNKASKLTKLPKLIKFLRVMRLLKLLRMYRITKFIRDLEINYNLHHGISRLLHIWLVIMFVTHFVGCLWHATGTRLDVDGAKDLCNDKKSIMQLTNDASLNEGWVCREGMIDASVTHKYVSSKIVLVELNKFEQSHKNSNS